jgi:hypothetical protein
LGAPPNARERGDVRHLSTPRRFECAVTTSLAEQPLYWTGIATWTVGFALYLRVVFGDDETRAARLGTALCWLGLVLTALPLLAAAGRGPTAPRPALGAGPTAYTGIWLLWILGGLAVVGSWLRMLGPRIGWLGLCLAMTGVIASSVERAAAQRLVMACGVIVVALLAMVSVQRGELGQPSAAAGDYEAELVALCGSKRKAERLIREEQERSPALSRVGAAMAVVTRMRVEREGLGPPL